MANPSQVTMTHSLHVLSCLPSWLMYFEVPSWCPMSFIDTVIRLLWEFGFTKIGSRTDISMGVTFEEETVACVVTELCPLSNCTSITWWKIVLCYMLADGRDIDSTSSVICFAPQVIQILFFLKFLARQFPHVFHSFFSFRDLISSCLE